MIFTHGAPATRHLNPDSSWHVELHPSPDIVLPSSQPSPGVTLPSPQTAPSGLLFCCPPHATTQSAANRTILRITHQTTPLEKRLNALCCRSFRRVESPHR